MLNVIQDGTSSMQRRQSFTAVLGTLAAHGGTKLAVVHAVFFALCRAIFAGVDASIYLTAQHRYILGGTAYHQARRGRAYICAI
jgi:hypothetical protein